MSDIICAECNQPIEGKDLVDRHSGHEKGCLYKWKEFCYCDLEYHARCCPDCRPGRQRRLARFLLNAWIVMYSKPPFVAHRRNERSI